MSDKMSKEDLKWRAEADARTLETYQEIINDKERLKLALAEAEKRIDNLKERAITLSKSLTGLKKK